MERQYVNKEVLNIQGGALEAVMRAYLAEKTPQNMAAFVDALSNSKFLVPVEFPKQLTKDVAEKLKRGEKLSPQEMPKMLPILLKNKDEEHFAPAYTSKEQLPKDHQYMAIMPVSFADILRVSRIKEYKIKAIVINPNTDNVILADKMMNMMEKIVNGGDICKIMEEEGLGSVQKQKLSMTVEQFHIFARRNVEVGLIPKLAFQHKGKFMESLESKGSEVLLELYRGMYKANVPFPYEQKDFDIMTLQIRDDLQISSIEFPAKNLGAGACRSGYAVWNPQKEEMQYFVVELTKNEEPARLVKIMPDGKGQVLGEAPAPGSEMFTIIEMLDKQ